MATDRAEFDPKEIARASFPTAFRGYDTEAVRRYLSRLAAAVGRAQQLGLLGMVDTEPESSHVRLAELEHEGANLRNSVADLESMLAEAEALVAERDALLAEREAQLAERDALLAEREAQLAERDALLAEPSAAEPSASPAAISEQELDEAQLIEMLGHETARIVSAARSAATDIVRRAEANADAVRNQADAEAEATRQEAEQVLVGARNEAGEVLASADQEAKKSHAGAKADARRRQDEAKLAADKIVADASDRAAADLATARQRAAEIVADAEKLRGDILSDLVRRRRLTTEQIDRLSVARDRLAHALATARNELDGVAADIHLAVPGPSEVDLTEEQFGRVEADSAEVSALVAQLQTVSARRGDTNGSAESTGGGGGGDHDAVLGDIAVDRILDEVTVGDGIAVDDVTVGDGIAVDDVTVDDVTVGDGIAVDDVTVDEVTVDDPGDVDYGGADDRGGTDDLGEEEHSDGGGDGDEAAESVGAGDGAADGEVGLADAPSDSAPRLDPATAHEWAKSVDPATPSPQANRPVPAPDPISRREPLGSSDAARPARLQPVAETDPIGLLLDPVGGASAHGAHSAGVGGRVDRPSIGFDDTMPVQFVDTPVVERPAVESRPGRWSDEHPDATFDAPRSDGGDGVAFDAPGSDGGDDELFEQLGLSNDPVLGADTLHRSATRGDLPRGTPYGGTLTLPFKARNLTMIRATPGFRRRLKRAVNDDQSDVLDRLRAGRGNIQPDELPPLQQQLESYIAALHPVLLDVVRAGGELFDSDDVPLPAVDNLSLQLARHVVECVRLPTIDAINATADHDREVILDPVRAIYRDFRNKVLPDLIEDALHEAFAMGLFNAIGAGERVLWVNDPRLDSDPICEDNSSSPPLPKGIEFPSGHQRPLSMPGCRCLALPAR